MSDSLPCESACGAPVYCKEPAGLGEEWKAFVARHPARFKIRPLTVEHRKSSRAVR